MKIFLIKLKNILKSKYLFKILFILSILYIFLYIKIDKKTSIYAENEDVFYGIITNYKYDNSKFIITIDAQEDLIVYYDDIIEIEYGDKIKIQGTLSKPVNSTVFNLFDYKKYLERKKIYFIVYAKKIDIIERNQSIIYDIKNKLVKRIKKIKKSNSYIKTFLLGDKSDIDSNILDSYKINGISHLFSISGMHISLFSNLLYYFIKKISYNNYYNFFIVFLFLLIYMIILGCPISVVRSVIMFIIFSVNKLFNLHISKLDLMLIVFIIITLINPYYIYDISFLFSYVISFFLVIFSNQIKTKKHKKLYMSFLCFLVSLPIVIYNYYEVSVLSFLFNLFFIPLVSIIIFPLSILTFFIPILDNILYFFINILECSSLYLNKLDFLIVNFAKPSMYLIIIYYVLLLFYFYNNKCIYIIISLLIMYRYKYYFDNSIYITYLDVGQGDSIVINYKSDVILIDTGGSYYGNDLLINNTISYLKSIGQHNIDYLIISHGDNDHMGNSIGLVNNFEVDNVIFNCGEYNDLENKLIELLKNKNISYYSCIKELNMNKYKLQFLNTEIYSNENDNSSVIYLNYNNYKFLFMGDASTKREFDILKKYKLTNIDFLKVGHHGSDTSSGSDFISSIKPKYSLISVGLNNRYGHPKETVLDILEKNNSKVYRTDIDGSIEIKIKSDGYSIETCEP